MNVKLHVLSAGALFFLGQAAFAQKSKNDSVLKENKIDEVIVTGYQKKKQMKLPRLRLLLVVMKSEETPLQHLLVTLYRVELQGYLYKVLQGSRGLLLPFR